MEVSVLGGGSICFKQEYLHRFSNDFGHKIGCGGGSGDSGGFFAILCDDALFYGSEICQSNCKHDNLHTS